MSLSPFALDQHPINGGLQTPHSVRADEVSVVIPVRNNAAGVARAVESLARVRPTPSEVIVVDSASTIPYDASRFASFGFELRVVRVDQPGAARARNVGWRLATGTWVHFMDSDCVAEPGILAGYGEALNGAIAYAGGVRAAGRDRWSRYYDSQKILVPPPDGRHRPCYLVTANALVLRAALEHIGGFDERFPLAAGEDIDLAYRLQRLGRLSFAPRAVMLHEFEPTAAGFVRRFVRYGRGNRQLEVLHGQPLRPRPFAPAQRTVFNHVAAAAQFVAMFAGYEIQRAKERTERRAPRTITRNLVG